MEINWKIAVIALGVMACKPEYVTEQSDVQITKKARTVALEPITDPLPILTSGKLAPLEEVNLSFKIGGVIAEISVDEGDYVKEGQVLASLFLSEIDAQVDQASAQVEKLERDLNRFENLRADSAATLQAVQDLETGLQVAQSALAIAEFNRSYSQIIVPFNGRILKKYVEAGELINPGTPVFTLETNAGKVIRVTLSDRDVVKVSLGDPAEVQMDAYPNVPFEATISKIAANGHPVTGTFEVELAISQNPRTLRSGFFARAKILPTTVQPYFKVPIQAIRQVVGEEVVVFEPVKDKVSARQLKPEVIGDDFFTVTASDTESMSVLTEGADYLRVGDSFEALK